MTMPIELAPNPYDPTGAPDAAPTRASNKRFWMGFAAGIGAATLVAGIAAGSMALIHTASGPGTFEITGTLTLTGRTTTSGLPSDFKCAGSGGYTDISPSASVTVSDESGKLLAKGRLTGSSGGTGHCVFDFTVSDVPRGSDFYKVEISHRGAVTYTESEAESGPSLSLGN